MTPQLSKSPKSRFFHPSFVLSLIVFLNFLWSTPGFAMTTADFKDEIDKVNKLITGGYMHLGLMAMCGFGGVICIIERKLTGAIICAAACLFVYLMKGWIGTNFAAVI